MAHSTIWTSDGIPQKIATIRVKAFQPGGTEDAGYLSVELLEFHPDFEERAKFRGHALVRPREEFRRPEHAPIYRMCGDGYLEQPYISINEVFIHDADLAEMMRWCRRELARRKQYTPLIIHPQPLPFPLFERGTRVRVLPYKDRDCDTVADKQAGQLATTAEKSSLGAMTQVTFDAPARG